MLCCTRKKKGSGSYFVVYVIHCACLSNASALLRLPERFYFLWARHSAITTGERAEAQKNWPFYVGQQYAVVCEVWPVCAASSLVLKQVVPTVVLFHPKGLLG